MLKLKKKTMHLTMTRTNKSNPSSDKKFGIFCSCIFGLSSVYYFFSKFSSFIWLALFVISCLVVFTAFYKPIFFNKPNSLWFSFAILLGRIFNPIVLGTLYFLVLTPISFITKSFGRDELLLKKFDQKTYWLVKDKVLKNSQSYKDQF